MSKAAIIVAFAVAVWAFCGAIMGIGPLFMSMDSTLIVHAIGGPLGAAVAAALYHRFFAGVSPIALAAAYVGTALALDFFLVAPVFVGNYDMFASPLGLWIPMALIFLAAWGAGSVAVKAGEA
ncbi:hypothetical protein [Thalassovita aquimarina]|uniref:Uncharacterized protein n=1 Tax=Thalassovita aquimarina TaxID=2785917 RepID=A0ABS5HX10_9RHOB|nr:hypothetical protein [Thalassovita aquimarina]MBR9653491.1 hypothetical protein [Thalassovita aquimarina]